MQVSGKHIISFTATQRYKANFSRLSICYLNLLVEISRQVYVAKLFSLHSLMQRIEQFLQRVNKLMVSVYSGINSRVFAACMDYSFKYKVKSRNLTSIRVSEFKVCSFRIHGFIRYNAYNNRLIAQKQI